MALLRERIPTATFVHTPASGPPPCAVLCLDCRDNPKIRAHYAAYGLPVEFGSFLGFRLGDAK